jgi:iron complex outermembrane receptor protein
VRRGAVVAFLALAVSAARAAAQTVADRDLTELTLEQLANLRVTSVSRRAQPLREAPASIFVITSEDIRRSGATSLAEALRLAPNLQVARIDAGQYAISARGFNGLAANKLLVLVDGRTIYTPLFSGVFWDQQDVLVEDIERIEVISGPGGAARAAGTGTAGVDRRRQPAGGDGAPLRPSVGREGPPASARKGDASREHPARRRNGRA